MKRVERVSWGEDIWLVLCRWVWFGLLVVGEVVGFGAE